MKWCAGKMFEGSLICFCTIRNTLWWRSGEYWHKHNSFIILTFFFKGKSHSDLKFAVELVVLFSEMLGFFLVGGCEPFFNSSFSRILIYKCAT